MFAVAASAIAVIAASARAPSTWRATTARGAGVSTSARQPTAAVAESATAM